MSLLIVAGFVGTLIISTTEQERMNTKLENILVTQNKQIQDLHDTIKQNWAEVEKNKVSTPVVIPEKVTPKFSTLDEYVNFSLDRTKSSFFEVDKPEGFEYLSGGQDTLNVAPLGSGYNFVGVLVKSTSEQTRNMDEIRPFYLEVERSSICKADCTKTQIHTWYGPFEGPILRMVE